MSFRKTIRLSSLILSALCLGVGCAFVGLGIAFATALVPLLAWLCAYKWPSPGLLSVALVASVSLAAIGLFVGASPFLMLLGAIFALANWDLGFLDHDLAGGSSAKTVTFFEKKHYQSLALALGISLLATIISRIVRFQIPFGIMIFLVILTFFSLGRVWQVLSD